MAFLLALLFASATPIAAGAPAPDFTAKNQDGKEISLSDYRGKPVLIYFYPKDGTPGCTKEACTLRDNYAAFQKAGAVIFGVSRQDAASHREFREKYHLPFDLLVDEDGKLAEKFGVASIPGVGLDQRQSVLIGKDGKVVKFFDDVKPANHSAEVLAQIQAHQ